MPVASMAVREMEFDTSTTSAGFDNPLADRSTSRALFVDELEQAEATEFSRRVRLLQLERRVSLLEALHKGSAGLALSSMPRPPMPHELAAASRGVLVAFCLRLRGGGSAAPSCRKPAATILANFVLSFMGTLLLSVLHFGVFEHQDLMLLTGSQAAAAVLVFAAAESPLAQPPNVIVGNFLSGVVGVGVRYLEEAMEGGINAGSLQWLAAPLAVSLAILVMDCSRTLHPPGGATALLAVVGSDKLKALGWLYPLIPATLGGLLLVCLATLGNNAPPLCLCRGDGAAGDPHSRAFLDTQRRVYPDYWLGGWRCGFARP